MSQTQVSDVDPSSRAVASGAGPTSTSDAAPTADRPTRRRVIDTAFVVVTVGLCAAATVVSGAPAASTVGVVAMLPAALVDLHERRLPDRLVAAAALAVMVVVVVGATSGAATTPTHLVAGSALLAGPLLLVHLASPASMGFGDVKAAVVLGAAVGAVDPVGSLLALTLAAAVGAGAGLVARRRTVAFGPALVVGSAAALLVTRSVIA